MDQYKVPPFVKRVPEREPRVRCHDCRRDVPIDKSVRYEVEAGRTRTPFIIAWGTSFRHYKEVDLCLDCYDDREDALEARRRNNTTWAVVFISIFVAAVLGCGFMCSAVFMMGTASGLQ